MEETKISKVWIALGGLLLIAAIFLLIHLFSKEEPEINFDSTQNTGDTSADATNSIERLTQQISHRAIAEETETSEKAVSAVDVLKEDSRAIDNFLRLYGPDAL